MAFEQITVEQRGRVALLTLNRPEKLNAWTPRMMAELTEAMRAAADDSATGAIVLTGAGRAFCAGADVDAVFRKQSEVRDSGSESTPPPASAAAPAAPPPQNWVSFLRNLPKPTIAAVNGAAVGIGVTQVLPMDFRIASENARFGMFFVKMGLVPELASSALLPQMVGQARALDWCLTGRMIPAAEAREAGLVSEVVAADGLVDRAVELGEQLAGQSAFAMTNIRKLILANTNEDDLTAAQRREGAALNDAYRSWEHKEAIEAFLTKRPANFQKQSPTPIA
ncbi:MAG TPA: enoyl-CoA hydratase-related protein [Tepidiformaceae bacterium]|nr:enoyl-CoA hydratase-related protein [Tepidiformaceae bacterium]